MKTVNRRLVRQAPVGLTSGKNEEYRETYAIRQNDGFTRKNYKSRRAS